MIIKSAFRDYYDNVTQYGLDPNVQFLRGRTTYQQFHNEGDRRYNLESYKETNDPQSLWINEIIIGFVDTLYCCRVYRDSPSRAWQDRDWGRGPMVKIDYDLASWPYKTYSGKRKWRNYYSSAEKYWGETLNESPIPEWLQAYGPIFVLEQYQVIISPKLSDYGFAKIVSPVDAYRRLYQWVCNQRQPVKPIPEMPNDTKIEQAGFDLKHSFRKGKAT